MVYPSRDAKRTAAFAFPKDELARTTIAVHFPSIIDPAFVGCGEGRPQLSLRRALPRGEYNGALSTSRHVNGEASSRVPHTQFLDGGQDTRSWCDRPISLVWSQSLASRLRHNRLA